VSAIVSSTVSLKIPLFYDTCPKDPITWLSLVSLPRISILTRFRSPREFMDKVFKVVVKSTSRSIFYDDNRNTKFPFFFGPTIHGAIRAQKGGVVSGG